MSNFKFSVRLVFISFMNYSPQNCFPWVSPLNFFLFENSIIVIFLFNRHITFHYTKLKESFNLYKSLSEKFIPVSIRRFDEPFCIVILRFAPDWKIHNSFLDHSAYANRNHKNLRNFHKLSKIQIFDALSLMPY